MKNCNLDDKNDDVCEVFDSHEDVVNRIKGRIPDEDEFSQLSDFFKIFGNPTRLKIISLLCLEDLCVCDICEALDLNQTTVSNQLRILRANNIVKYRNEKSIDTTLELVEIIKKSMPYKAMKDSHPARKTFQAIRIEVNDELNVLRDALEEAIEMLNVGGRISVITFHSLEDKIVKEIFNKYSKVDSSLSKLPFIPKEYLPKFKLIANITPSKVELEENNRARSSRLRVIERIED